MRRNVVAIYKRGEDYIGGVWDSWESYYKDTFSPEREEVFAYDFTTKGKTYQDRKEFVRDYAVEWSHTWSLYGVSWSCLEMNIIEGEFRRLGKRYGLLREFRENWIC